MTLSEMHRILSDRGIQLTRSLGQNFLHDGNQLRRIVEAAELQPGDKILEIGPGLGPLTELLLANGVELLAIEKDARLVNVLRERFKLGPAPRSANTATAVAQGHETPALRLVHDDALKFLRREPHEWSGWKLVANLPYSVASPILVELAQCERGPERMVATLQLEVARRLMALPRAADYGVLTLLVQLAYEPQAMFRIPASCFFPEPEIDSACVTLVRRAQPLLPPKETGAFARLIKLAFSQRRKMMLKLLKQNWPGDRLEAAFAELGLSLQTRAEAVALEQFVRLTELLSAR